MAKSAKILVVEDNEAERRGIAAFLRSEGLSVVSADSADKAMGYLEEGVDLVLTDLQMGEVSGIDLLNLWKNKCPQTQFILITGHSSVDTAVAAIKAGAYDYVTKPINIDELSLLIKRALGEKAKDEELDNLRRRLDQKFGLDRIVGQSRPMKDVFDKIGRAAPVDSTVLILGESGTGKELVAQALHHNGLRKSGPFVAVNCAAVPATLVESELFGHVRGAFTGATDRRVGRFEQADGGTLFIDEIGDFEIGLQAKLLRVLETLTVTPVGGAVDKKVDVRVVAATSRDIQAMVRDGTFREDLYYRLNVVTLHLPALRERTDDIPILVDHFLKEITESRKLPQKRVTPEVMRILSQYHWPGNVRELRNALESMVVLGDGVLITEADLPERIIAGGVPLTRPQEIPAGMKMDELERLAINKALGQCGGNRTHAAGKLGISVRTLQRKLRQYERDASSGELGEGASLRSSEPGDMLTGA